MWDHSTETLTSEGCLTDIAGIRVGHFTDSRRPTGCTVVLAEAAAIAGVDCAVPLRERARRTCSARSTPFRRSTRSCSRRQRIRLDAASGVMQYLEEEGIGFDMRVAVCRSSLPRSFSTWGWRRRYPAG